MRPETDNSTSVKNRPNETIEKNTPKSVFLIVFAMLCGLTAISFWIANSYLMDYRPLAWGAMVAVSVAKATLVVLFFMHLWWERAWKYVLTIPAMIMGSLLVTLLVPDIAMRSETYSKQRRLVAPEVSSIWESQMKVESDLELK